MCEQRSGKLIERFSAVPVDFATVADNVILRRIAGRDVFDAHHPSDNLGKDFDLNHIVYFTPPAILIPIKIAF